MRPAVSRIFCLPVKNGWQPEQISMWKSPRVERVSMTFPQAHRTLAGWYFGWMPSRMMSFRGPLAWRCAMVRAERVPDLVGSGVYVKVWLRGDLAHLGAHSGGGRAPALLPSTHHHFEELVVVL